MKGFDPKNYWETRLKDNFGLHGTGYIGLGKKYNDWLYRVRKRVLFSRMRSMGINFDSVKVLDVGSGSGFYVECWKRLGARKVIGTDLTNVAIEELQKKYPDDEFHQLDIGREVTKLPKHEFDIVSALDVLFHIVDEVQFETAIRNIYSLLKPGGLFVFSDNFIHGEAITATYQVSRPLDGIVQTLDAVGFEIVKRVPMLFLMNNPVDSNSRMLKSFWRILTKGIAVHELAGFLAGATLYPVELICVFFMKESPTTEMMICRKPGH